MSPHVRPPAVAGAFYPGSGATLLGEVDALLAGAEANGSTAKAFIVPHAGYVYSGPIAASVYAQLARRAPKPTRVVLLGPSHHVGFLGLALPGCEFFDTPLGRVPLDVDSMKQLSRFEQVRVLPRAHAKEHSLEVQLPFLQRALGDFTLVPLVVGDASPAEVAEVLEVLWGGPETVVLVSSDLSHFLPSAEARVLDGETARRIVALDAAPLEGEEACGCRPVNGLLEVARRKRLVASALDVRNSGDTAGDRSRVVGYGAFAFTETAS
ncbi:MAG: AmmeMemoRadiSam system protein B [Myxococcaceae bacterium]|nr:AmmeMemoRadiSam system protein B [Myxococcaceae bacterium]